MRVGAENAGWRLVTTQLNHERVMLGPAGRLAALYDRVYDWAAGRAGPDGRPLLSQPDVRRALARSYAGLRINELLNWQVAVAEHRGRGRRVGHQGLFVGPGSATSASGWKRWSGGTATRPTRTPPS